MKALLFTRNFSNCFMIKYKGQDRIALIRQFWDINDNSKPVHTFDRCGEVTIEGQKFITFKEQNDLDLLDSN